MLKRKSKSVLITGVSSGIGYGLARAFVKKGYIVFGSVRRQNDAERLAGELGPGFKALVFDVTDAKGVEASVKKVREELKGEGLGGLINNAGMAAGGPLMHQSLDEIRGTFEVNVIGLLSVTKACLPLLGAEENHNSLPGRIINISSVGGKIAGPFIGAYNGSKFAVEGISHSLRRELLLYGIDVVIIGPGAVNTPIWDKSGDGKAYEGTRYYDSLIGFAKYFIEQGRKGFSVERISNEILKIFEKRKPKARYALVPNKFTAWTIPRLLPDRMLDRIIGKRLGFIK